VVDSDSDSEVTVTVIVVIGSDSWSTVGLHLYFRVAGWGKERGL
jgi:hypothetical protein